MTPAVIGARRSDGRRLTWVSRARPPKRLNAGDQLDDLFLYNPASGEWFTAINDAGNGFTRFGGLWARNWSVFPGDFNFDGRSDIFVYNSTTADWALYINNNDGQGGFSESTGLWATGWTVQVAELGSPEVTPGDPSIPDGYDDVFVYNPGDGNWFQCINNRTGGFVCYREEIVWNQNWRVFATDFNADRLSDILLYNPATAHGQWFQCMNNGVRGRFTYATGSWGLNWNVIAQTTRIP